MKNDPTLSQPLVKGTSAQSGANGQLDLPEGDTNAVATATSYTTNAHSTGLLFENSVNLQHNSFTLGNSATSEGIGGLVRQMKARKPKKLRIWQELLNNNPDKK